MPYTFTRKIDYVDSAVANDVNELQEAIEALSKLGLDVLADPGSDRVLFWDDSEGALKWLTISTGLAITTDSLALSHLGLQDLADPDADRVLFWDDSEGKLKWLTLGDGLTITGTTIAPSSALHKPISVGGRLTLESGEPISIADQLAKSTVYYTPYIHNGIALYNDTASKWQMFSLAEKSLDISAANANTNYDIFLDYNSGNPTLRSLAWTDASTRATALVRQDGVLVKSGAPAQRYLGTFRTTGAAGKTEDSLAKRFLWNMYNRVPRLGGIDEATSHTYNSSVWRQWNDTPTLTEFVIGQRMTIAASARANIKIDNTAYSAKFAIVKDSAVIVASNFDYSMTLTTNTISTWSTIEFKTQCEVGYHYINVLEQVSTGGKGTFSEVITYLLLIE